MTYRPKKPGDQAIGYECMKILLECILSNEDLGAEAVHWVGAMHTMIAKRCYSSGISYEEYCRQLDEVKEYYKYMWEEE